MRARACALVLVAACGHPVKPQPPPAVRIVATERGPSGGRLVVIDEAGLRTAELVPAAVETARDNSAVFSPDGKWIAFASSRGRGESLEHTSLWIVAAELDAQPLRITDFGGDDLAPAWTPDGGALVFASDRGGTFDLWRIAVAPDGAHMRARGKPVQLTKAPGAELAPSVAPDGRIAFASITKEADGSRVSRIAVLEASGDVHDLTNGPGDITPAWSPDGKTLVFSAPVGRGTIVMQDGSKQAVIDADLFAVDPDGGNRRVFVEAPGTDESGAVWSHDGRWIFATSLARSVDGKPLLSSIVYADLRAPAPMTIRMLREPSAPVSRLAPALAPSALDDKTLAAGPGYKETLDQIMMHALLKNEEQ
ncbi:MAG TPA: hypothetical protein VL463_20460 [Kofleriaceae bacterium]|nr:hypothetical protein [Kofleriaceae bacterium]